MRVAIVQSMRDRIECMRVRPLLQPFLDGELHDVQRARMQAHLQACRRCGLAASSYRSLMERLHEFDQPVDHETVARLERFADDLDGGVAEPEQDDGDAV